MDKLHRRTVLTLLGSIAEAIVLPKFPAAAQSDPLPSWDDGKAKQSILDFVSAVTGEGSTDSIPGTERIATFDNDGTLWVEHPMYTQLAFAIDRVKTLAPQHPEWKDKQPFKAPLDGDMDTLSASGEHGLVELLMATHANMKVTEFVRVVKVSIGVQICRPNDSQGMDYHSTPSEVQATLYFTRLSAYAGSDGFPSCQRVQDLHCIRSRHRVYASLDRSGLWRSS